MKTALPARVLIAAGLCLVQASCDHSAYPQLLPFEALSPPPPRPPGLVEELQARAAALDAAATAQRAVP